MSGETAGRSFFGLPVCVSQPARIRILVYDGQGFWLAQKRLSKGRFVWWPSGNQPTRVLEAHQAQLLLAAGNPDAVAAPVWRRVSA